MPCLESDGQAPRGVPGAKGEAVPIAAVGVHLPVCEGNGISADEGSQWGCTPTPRSAMNGRIGVVVALAALLVCVPGVRAEQAAVLTTLRAIHALTNEQAKKALPVDFEATVTCFTGKGFVLFVQDGNAGIYIRADTHLDLQLGDRVRVRGRTQDSFRPIVIGNDITFLRHGSLPKPVPASFEQMIRGDLDCLLVTVRGRVVAADQRNTFNLPVAALQLLVGGSSVEADIYTDHGLALDKLLDAEVEVTGVAAARFDDRMEQTGVLLQASTPASVRLIEPSHADPWSLAVTPMDEILHVYHVVDLSQRVHVRGTVTYYRPGSAAVLQSGSKSLWVSTRSSAALTIGDLADATGLPSVNNGFMTLLGGEIRDSGTPYPITPQAVTWQEVARAHNTPVGHHYDLISIEGRVVMQVRQAAQDEYVLISGDHRFSAVYEHPRRTGADELPAMREIPVGSMVRVTGICMPESSDPLNGPIAFNLLLRSFDDIRVAKRPSPLNVRNLIVLVGLLLALAVGAGVRSWSLERKVRRQTAALASRIEREAAMERRRSRILEDINGNEPLAGILEEVTELVSFHMGGAPCWCEIADGARLGGAPRNTANLRMAVAEIRSHSGPALGMLFAGLPAGSPVAQEETEALSMGSKLAALAIETRRLYADLVHRSEFDLLTDILNRFSLEKNLEQQIEEARENASIFGLIYIDLDDFKLVNDQHGHTVGDLYLQEVALRMKGQLRSADLLARLGGDEFAALVPAVRNRAEVEEIALRLERSLDETFAVNGYRLRGTASVGIALYPEDATTRDGLLTAADAAMYAAKHAKHLDQKEPGSQTSWIGERA